MGNVQPRITRQRSFTVQLETKIRVRFPLKKGLSYELVPERRDEIYGNKDIDIFRITEAYEAFCHGFDKATKKQLELALAKQLKKQKYKERDEIDTLYTIEEDQEFVDEKGLVFITSILTKPIVTDV
eukprot:TRINITY_DN9752_c0_g1_i1.p1 TRINITY_DN9752_c0_g1~~TRINITY_DN9752_c0_g1_i1.p1  ORF type:complete len:127 (+),score=15.11 TRINITY_DN9752_c0_g1_i1:50-430(+)